MKNPFYKALVAASIFTLGNSIAEAQDQKVLLATCLDAGFENLIAAKSLDFSSPQYRVVCQHRDIERRERNDTYTYEVPAGYRIDGARFSVVVKSTRTSVGELVSQGQRATISLQCHGDADHVENHFGVGGNIVGRLVYQPTLEDTKKIAGACLDQALR